MIPINHVVHRAGKDVPLRTVMIDGEPWHESFISKDDDMLRDDGKPNWGGGVRNMLHSRVDLRPAQPEFDIGAHTINFNFIVPEEWPVRNNHVLAFAIHDKSSSGVPFTFHIAGHDFRVVGFETIARAGEVLKLDERMRFKHRTKYEFTLITKMSDSGNGYYKMLVNGEQWFRVGQIRTFHEGEDLRGPHWDTGLYIGGDLTKGVDNWAPGVNSYRLLFQV